MFVIFSVLLIMNCLTEFMFNKMMLSLHIINKDHIIFHSISALTRIIWLFISTWFAIPLPIVMIVLYLLFEINILPYRSRFLIMNHFTMMIYLIYITLLMLTIGCVGLLGFNMQNILQDVLVRVFLLNITFIIFNLVCFLLLIYRPELLWKEEYDRLEVVLYTRFLFVCCIYHIFDSFMIILLNINQITCFLLVSGDILILILMFNFLKYNYVFMKNEILKKEYEQNEILIAQQYFEKESLRKMSEYDSLTKTYNRREISAIMLDHIQKGHKLTCVFVDLDGLKHVNDQYGHAEGDRMLIRFANASLQCLGDTGKLARIGGDEFLLVFFDKAVHEVQLMIDKLQKTLLNTAIQKDKIYFSFGISYDQDTIDDYIKIADKKMYECKKRKRQVNVI